jgi:hypothetical protein
MSIYVPPKTATLLRQAQDIIQNKAEGKTVSRSRVIPTWLYDGSEVKTVRQAATMMNLDERTAAQYIVESKEALNDLQVDAIAFLERKTIRKVRTPAGRKRFNQPIGSVIVRDGERPLKNVTIVNSVGGWDVIEGPDGGRYEIGYDSDNDTWVATGQGDWDDVLVDYATDEEEAYRLLDRALTSKKRKKGDPPIVGSQKSKSKPKGDFDPQGLPEPQHREYRRLRAPEKREYARLRNEGVLHNTAMASASGTTPSSTRKRAESVLPKKTSPKKTASSSRSSRANWEKNWSQAEKDEWQSLYGGGRQAYIDARNDGKTHRQAMKIGEEAGGRKPGKA